MTQVESSQNSVRIHYLYPINSGRTVHSRRLSHQWVPMRNFIVVGVIKPLVIEVLLAIHTFTDANCIVLGGSKETRILRFSSLCAAYLEASFSGDDDDRFVEKVNFLGVAMSDLVLIPADTQSTRMLNRVRSRLKVRLVFSPESSMLDQFDDKWRFYQFCKEHGLNVPTSCLIASKRDLNFTSTVAELGLPFVVKPLCEAASNGVHAIFSEADYDLKIRNNDAYRYAPLIVQRFISGTDVGLNLLAIQGKVAALAIQQRIVQKSVGSKIKFISNDYLVGAAHTLARESIYEGVMNVDARIEEGTGKVYLFESNPRFWRSLSASVWCGLNFVAESIDPSSPSGGIRMLTSGCADTYYHPLFRPLLWRYALFDFGQRGRMLRVKTYDLYTLSSSIKTIFLACMAHRSQVMALCEDQP